MCTAVGNCKNYYLKGEKFLSANGNRIFISFYFDEFPKTHFGELGLFERYKNPMSNKLSLLVTRIEGTKQCKDDIIEVIRNEITSLEKYMDQATGNVVYIEVFREQSVYMKKNHFAGCLVFYNDI